MTKPLPDVRVGQVWEDNDWRSRTMGSPRRVRVVNMPPRIEEYANPEYIGVTVENVETGKRSTVRLGRFRPNSTGYRMVDSGTNGTAYEVRITVTVAARSPMEAEQTTYNAVNLALDRAVMVREWSLENAGLAKQRVPLQQEERADG